MVLLQLPRISQPSGLAGPAAVKGRDDVPLGWVAPSEPPKVESPRSPRTAASALSDATGDSPRDAASAPHAPTEGKGQRTGRGRGVRHRPADVDIRSRRVGAAVARDLEDRRAGEDALWRAREEERRCHTARATCRGGTPGGMSAVSCSPLAASFSAVQSASLQGRAVRQGAFDLGPPSSRAASPRIASPRTVPPERLDYSEVPPLPLHAPHLAAASLDAAKLSGVVPPVGADMWSARSAHSPPLADGAIKGAPALVLAQVSRDDQPY